MKKRYLIAFILMFLVLLFLVLLSLRLGTVRLSYKDIFCILSGKSSDSSGSRVIWSIRFPRIMEALLLGGALSVSGFLLQTFFSNPIAGPYVLGISSGAKLTVALSMIFFVSHGIKISGTGMVLSAFAGSIIAMLFILLLSFKVKSMSVLVVIGIMIGYLCSAMTDFCVTFASDSNIVNLHNWSLGSFSGSDWNDIRIISLIVLPVIIFSFILSKPIGAFQMGEAYAENMGVNVRVLRLLLILLSSLLSATVTAFAGPISFVGIAVPHLIRTALKTSKPALLIPGCFLGGAIITLLCDGIARTVFSPTELSISSVTAFFLVPVVIYMMLSRQVKKQ